MGADREYLLQSIMQPREVGAGLSKRSDQQAKLFERLGLVAESVASVFGKVCEVVVHDLRNPEQSVVKIVHGHITGRAVGSTVLEGPKDDMGMEKIVEGGPPDSTTGAYRSTTVDGRPLKSSTAVFYDDDGKPLASFCINWDLTIFESLSDIVNVINADLVFEGDQASAAVETTDPRKATREIIDQVIASMGKPVYLMGKSEKMEAVGTMRKHGVFLIKGGVDMAAEVLGVSRYTVYGYLSEIKNRSAVEE